MRPEPVVLEESEIGTKVVPAVDEQCWNVRCVSVRHVWKASPISIGQRFRHRIFKVGGRYTLVLQCVFHRQVIPGAWIVDDGGLWRLIKSRVIGGVRIAIQRRGKFRYDLLSVLCKPADQRCPKHRPTLMR